MAHAAGHQPDGGFSTELSDEIKKRGITVGGGAPVSDSPLVFFGDSPRRRVQGDDGRGATVGGVQTKTLDEANASFYRLSPREVEELQRRMVAAGVLDPKAVRFGVHDDATYGAWSALNERAARFYAVGNRVTPDDALEMLGGAAGPAGQEASRSAREVAAAAFRTADRAYTPSDPATLRQAAETAFRTTLGRKPTKAEQAKFVGSFLGAQRANQSADFAFDDSGVADSRRRTLADADADDAVAVTNEAAASATGGGITPSGDTVPGAGGNESDDLFERVQRMIADSPYKITAGSRSRDYATQVRLYEAYKAGRGPRAAKPGTSKHGDGRANDLKYSSDEARQWALENAGKYGLHFPIYDPKLARGRDESWHVELSGSPGNSYGGAGRGAPGAASPTGAGPAMGVAPLSRTRIDPEIDAGARAVEFARNSNPTETKAYDIGTTFQSFVNILGRGVI